MRAFAGRRPEAGAAIQVQAQGVWFGASRAQNGGITYSIMCAETARDVIANPQRLEEVASLFEAVLPPAPAAGRIHSIPA